VCVRLIEHGHLWFLWTHLSSNANLLGAARHTNLRTEDAEGWNSEGNLQQKSDGNP